MLGRNRDHDELSEDAQAHQSDGMRDAAMVRAEGSKTTHCRPDRSEARALTQPTTAARKKGGRLMRSADLRDPVNVRAIVGQYWPNETPRLTKNIESTSSQSLTLHAAARTDGALCGSAGLAKRASTSKRS